jgi:hypothetical protein
MTSQTPKRCGNVYNTGDVTSWYGKPVREFPEYTHAVLDDLPSNCQKSLMSYFSFVKSVFFYLHVYMIRSCLTTTARSSSAVQIVNALQTCRKIHLSLQKIERQCFESAVPKSIKL